MLNKIAEFMRDEEGASAVEYGLIVGLIAAVIILVVAAIGGKLSGMFNTVNNGLTPT